MAEPILGRQISNMAERRPNLLQTHPVSIWLDGSRYALSSQLDQ